MKKLFGFILLLMISLNSFSQANEEDINALSIFSEYVKAKNYDAAFEPWMELRERSPKFNSAIYVYGERILKHKIKNSQSDEKVNFINDLLKLWEEKREHFPQKTPLGDILAKSAQLEFDYKEELGLTSSEIYASFDIAYNEDLTSFNNPKNLYTYFKLLVQLYDNNLKSAEDLFTKYDEISEKVEKEAKNYTNKVNKFISNSEEEITLSTKDQRRVKSYNSFLKAYDQITKGMEKDLGDRGNCDNLIPLYENNFESNQNDGKWLSRAMNRLYGKECDDSQLFVKIVQKKNELEPNASTAYYLGTIKDKQGNSSEALMFYNQAIELETDSYEKAKILFRIATNFRKNGLYSKARSYYMQALGFNPSMGRSYLAIAQMYASSAKNCGNDNFSQRAVYWLASREAMKASRVDGTLRSAAIKSSKNYEAKAPQKSEIFSSGREGEVIKISCWINRSVKVPNL
jgi:tetratricopeptide (TPR) repeat protein|tara:strand:+ start:480 stop:1856 length:1377 start_codon:yes stop_codon:yes gene_type:complete